MPQVLNHGSPPEASSPEWLSPTIERLSDLLALPPNWDSYGAVPIDSKCALAALRLLGLVMQSNSPSPSVVPTNRGGVQLEWHTNGIDLEIDVLSPTNFHVCYESSGESWQRGLSTDLSPLKGILARLSAIN